ncbi:MAG: radical SAM protein [Isosphaeraceae bacterium]
MCDLWRHTLDETVPEGAIAAQIQYALDNLPSCSTNGATLKLYNAGSFFDPRAIPPTEYPAIANQASMFSRVVVECHPTLIGPRCLAFRDLLSNRLEVAMGLETTHPEVLARLNKRMTLSSFRRAADVLKAENMDLRVFILVRPPWLSEAEGVDWAKRSLDFAFDCGASVCSLIPTRAGNGAMDVLTEAGEFTPPSLTSIEAAMEYGLSLRTGRIFTDLWDLSATGRCPNCFSLRIERLREMNVTQAVSQSISCRMCKT